MSPLHWTLLAIFLAPEFAVIAVLIFRKSARNASAGPRWVRGLKRLIRTAEALAKCQELPLPLRCLFVLAGLPVPGPFDEIVGGIALGIAATFYRSTVRNVWEGTA